MIEYKHNSLEFGSGFWRCFSFSTGCLQALHFIPLSLFWSCCLVPVSLAVNSLLCVSGRTKRCQVHLEFSISLRVSVLLKISCLPLSALSFLWHVHRRYRLGSYAYYTRPGGTVPLEGSSVLSLGWMWMQVDQDKRSDKPLMGLMQGLLACDTTQTFQGVD